MLFRIYTALSVVCCAMAPKVNPCQRQIVNVDKSTNPLLADFTIKFGALNQNRDGVTEYLNGALAFYESTNPKCNKSLSISTKPAATHDGYDADLSYAIVIKAKDSAAFNKLVRFFAIYTNNVVPAPTMAMDFSESLILIKLEPGFPVAAAMFSLHSLTYATCATYDPTHVPIVPANGQLEDRPGTTVNLEAEVLTREVEVNVRPIYDATFEPYCGIPSETYERRTCQLKKIKAASCCPVISECDIKRLIFLRKLKKMNDCLCKTQECSKKTKKPKKAHCNSIKRKIVETCAFTEAVAAIASCSEQRECQKVLQKCDLTEASNPLSVLACVLIRFASGCSKADYMDVHSSMIGPCACLYGSAKLSVIAGICEADSEMVNAICPGDEAEDSTVQRIVGTEEEENEEGKEGKDEESKKSRFTTPWKIATGVAVVGVVVVVAIMFY